MKQFLSTLLLALASFLMPTVMMATDYYVVGNWNEPETLYKLIISGKSAKVSIPAAVFGKNKPATFHVLAIESGTNRWNIKPAAVTAVTLGTAYDCSSYYNTHATHFTLADVKSTGSYTVTLDFSASNNINNSKLTLTYAEGGGGTPTTPADSKAYYLVGKWNNWALKSTTYKLQPVFEKENVYSIYINAPLNVYGDYAVNFVINPGGNTDWEKCLRPTQGSGDFVVDNQDFTDQPVYWGGNKSWLLKENKSPRGNTQNGGSYLFTLDMSDPSHPKWSIKNTPDVRVLYILSSENGWQFSGDYLVDTNIEPNNYNNNFTGLATLKSGMEYKLSAGFKWFGSTTENVAYNALPTTTTQKVEAGGAANVPYNGTTGTYSLEANVLGLNEQGQVVYEGAPRKEVIIRSAKSQQATHVYFKGGSITDYTEMTYDAARKIWYTSGIALDNNAPADFQEKFYNGNGTDITNSSTANDPLGKSTYKAIYVSTYESGTGSPVYKLLQTQKTSCVDGHFIRTYSDYYPRIIPEGLKAYYAESYDAASKTVSLKSIADGVIPAGTGVLLMYDGATEGINFDAINNADGVTTAANLSLEKSEQAGTAPANNYLMHEETDITLGPVTRDGSGTVTHRNYFFAYLKPAGSETKKLGFYRTKQSDGTGRLIRKAYLALPASVQPDASLDGLGYNTAAKVHLSAVASTTMTAAQGVKLLFDGEDLLGGFGGTTGLSTLNAENTSAPSDSGFYNLQGIRISRPAKGIYIHNGKKYVIK